MSETTDLATRPDMALERPLGVGESLDQGDLVIPRYKIVQPTSADLLDAGATMGTFVSTLDAGQGFDGARIVPLLLTKGRVLFEEGDDRPSCKSEDAITPSEQIEAPIHDVCAVRGKNGRWEPVCPSAIWEGSEPPPCAVTFNLLALNLDDMEMPFFITLKGTSARSAKKLNTVIQLRRVNAFAMSVEMALAKTKNAKGTFFVVDFRDFQMIDPADKYLDAFKQFAQYDPEKTYQAEEAGDTSFPPQD